MTRLTIELSGDQKQQIKALAALQGKTIKDYILDRALPESSEISEINALLKQAKNENNYSAWSASNLDHIRDTLK